MIRGLYTSAWSMLANTKQMDVISNNLANLNSNAYKRDKVILESFPESLTQRVNDNKKNLFNTNNIIGSMSLGNDVGRVFTYYQQGGFEKTDNKFDFAIENSDSGFFTVGMLQENDTFKEFYTRDGSFTVNANSQLVNKEGYLLLGENGPITVTGELMLQNNGVVGIDDKNIEKLKIKDFSNPETLKKIGNNLVQKTADTKEKTFTGLVRQGFLEQSNVNSVKEMVDMINVMRAYEANQKILQQHDNLLGKAVNEIGVVR